MRVVVVGGGIGGLTAAIALGRLGVDAHVYEQAAELREVGAGIALVMFTGCAAQALKNSGGLGTRFVSVDGQPEPVPSERGGYAGRKVWSARCRHCCRKRRKRNGLRPGKCEDKAAPATPNP